MSRQDNIVIVKVKQSSIGYNLVFTFEDVDYTAYSARINIWKRDTLLVDGGACTVALSGSDTIASYTVASAATATDGKDYLGEITFYSSTTFIEPSYSFKWQIDKSGEAL